MDTTLTLLDGESDVPRSRFRQAVARLGRRVYYVWVIGAGSFSIIYASSLYLLLGGSRRDPTQFRRWNIRMARTLMAATGIRVKTHYRARLESGRPYIFIANHQSLLDIPVAALAVPCPFGFVAKIELAKIPFLGHAIKYSPSVFMDRSNPRASMASIHRAAESIRAGNSVIIYAEGGRSYQKAMSDFKKGAFLLAVEAGVPLVPLVVQNTYTIVNERIGEARRGIVHVIVGEPISLEGVRRKDLNQLMQQVKSIMQDELDAEFPDIPVPHSSA